MRLGSQTALFDLSGIPLVGNLDTGGIIGLTREGCGSCPLRHLCAGGCRARALLSSGSLTARDPYCELSRSYYECMGSLLRKRYGPGGGERDAVRD